MPVVERLTVSGAVLATLAATLSIGNTLSMPRLRRPVTVETTERVVVCVPARDEETTLPLLIGDLRAQTYPGELRVIVLDDESHDGTLDAAHRAAGEDSRIVVESNTLPPPPGWTGKAAACRRLADLALADGPAAVTYLLPAVVAVLGSGRVRRVGTLGYLAGVIARLGSAISETAPFETAGGNDGAAERTTIDGMVRHVASAGVHPLSTVVCAGLVVDSHIRRARNTLSWKDRPLQRSTSTTPSRRVQKRKRRTPMSILDGAV
ncbi:glycosyltransferase [Rhodococcus zopfii]|uniref:glycosyltransferase n=1 Tax=Rhodococcus zopfii TaxID=43772 RepID=UPI001F0F4A8A|nr:glycosyltransferase [Rhodococcus zopfii]